MAHDKLDKLVKTGQIKAEGSVPDEIAGLIRAGLAKLEDSKNGSLSIQSRFDLAYNAAHALSLAALRHTGYRSQSRYIVFQCLKHTLDLPNEQSRVLDQAHKKRNLAEYEGDIDVNEQLVEALIRVTQEVAKRVSKIRFG
jgi:hypothetical protein